MKKFEALKTFEDACKVLRLDAKKVLPKFPGFPEKDRKAMQAHAKLVIIARATNKLANNGKEWTPDWNNHDQWKYYPWFEMGGSSGFRFHDCDNWASLSTVGSRLCYITSEVAEHVGTTFTDLYKEYFTF